MRKEGLLHHHLEPHGVDYRGLPEQHDNSTPICTKQGPASDQVNRKRAFAGIDRTLDKIYRGYNSR